MSATALRPSRRVRRPICLFVCSLGSARRACFAVCASVREFAACSCGPLCAFRYARTCVRCLRRWRSPLRLQCAQFAPTVDGKLLHESPLRTLLRRPLPPATPALPTIAGTTANESLLFVVGVPECAPSRSIVHLRKAARAHARRRSRLLWDECAGLMRPVVADMRRSRVRRTQRSSARH
jgi:hypothetical protein